MQKKNLFKQIASALLSVSIFMTPMQVEAVDTSATDNTVAGTGSWSSACGSWVTAEDNPTVYRCYPILLKESLDMVDKDSTVQLSYEEQYYTFRELALYTTSDTRATKAYHFISGTTRGANPIANMTLNSDATYDFSCLGVSLKLPTHKFNIYKSEYVSFSEEMNSKIITEGADENIKTIFENYIKEVSLRKDSLSDKGKYLLDDLITFSGYGTTNWDSYCKNFAFVFELCSTAVNVHDGNQYVLSYGDMIKTTMVKDDPWYIYTVFERAASKDSLLTWSAKHNERNITIEPEEQLGEVTYFFCNTNSIQPVTYGQSINVTLSYEEELKANISAGDVIGRFNTSTTVKNPSLALGSDAYVSILNNVSGSTLSHTNISLLDGVTVDTNKQNDTLQIMGNRSDFTNLDLMSYDVLKINLDVSGVCNLGFISKVDIQSIIDNITASTQTNIIVDGFGNTYRLKFSDDSSSVKSKIADSVSLIPGASSISDIANSVNKGTITDLTKLQVSTLLSSRIDGFANKSYPDGYLYNGKGNVNVSLAYLYKDKQVTSKEAEVYINANEEVSSIKDIREAEYSVSTPKNWDIAGVTDAYKYVIAWKSSDYDLTDEEALAKSLLNNMGDTYALRGEEGKNTIKNAFKSATGVSPIGVKLLGSEDSIDVGAVANEDDTLTGVNVLVVNVSNALSVKINSTDYLESNELNFVYPNLLGASSSCSNIFAMNSGIITDDNFGDLISFKGSKVHFYNKASGLFGVYTQPTKTFSSVSYPSYAYNLTRGLWGDSLVASSYRGLSATDSAVKNDLVNNLGVSIGAVGTLSSVTCGDNIDGTVDTTKKDVYLFTHGNKSINRYTITHSLNKYTCMSLPTALNTNSGNAGFNIQNNAGINNKITMVTQSAETLTLYPEVEYKYYHALSQNGVLNKVQPLSVYLMGERARTFKPSSIRGIDMDYSTRLLQVAKGDITSSGAMTGSGASSMSDGKMVVAQGSDISMSANNLVDYRLISYSLDIVNEYAGVSVRDEFSSLNANYKPDAEHNEYVDKFIKNVKVDTYMTIGNKEYKMNTSVSRAKAGTTESTYFSMEFKDGVLTEASKNAVINDMAYEYNITIQEATEMFESSGFETQLQAMFESSTDTNNASKNKWYDEECITLVIRKYITSVNLGDVLVNDKIDYNVVGTTGRGDSGSVKHTTANAYFSIAVELPVKFNDCNLLGANKLFAKQKITGTDFKVSSTTTNDFIN